MLVMYWNCTCPISSMNRFCDEKRKFIGKLVDAMRPDLLCLDEFSEQVNDTDSAKDFSKNNLGGEYLAKAVLLMMAGI